MKELAMLCDSNYSSPAINTSFFPDIAAGKYWTGSSVFGHDDKQWFVDLSEGMTSYEDPSSELYVLCVRGSNMH